MYFVFIVFIFTSLLCRCLTKASGNLLFLALRVLIIILFMQGISVMLCRPVPYRGDTRPWGLVKAWNRNITYISVRFPHLLILWSLLHCSWFLFSLGQLWHPLRCYPHPHKSSAAQWEQPAKILCNTLVLSCTNVFVKAPKKGTFESRVWVCG